MRIMAYRTSDTAPDTAAAILGGLLTDEGSADPCPLLEQGRALGGVVPAGDGIPTADRTRTTAPGPPRGRTCR